MEYKIGHKTWLQGLGRYLVLQALLLEYKTGCKKWLRGLERYLVLQPLLLEYKISYEKMSSRSWKVLGPSCPSPGMQNCLKKCLGKLMNIGRLISGLLRNLVLWLV